jgi:hypothetical protein
MLLQASIFASLYNNCRKSTFVAFAAKPLIVLCTVSRIDVLTKMLLQASIFALLYNNCGKSTFVSLCGKQAFLHRGIIKLRKDAVPFLDI